MVADDAVRGFCATAVSVKFVADALCLDDRDLLHLADSLDVPCSFVLELVQACSVARALDALAPEDGATLLQAPHYHRHRYNRKNPKKRELCYRTLPSLPTNGKSVTLHSVPITLFTAS